MFVLGNVIKPQGLEPLQFSTKFRAPSHFGVDRSGVIVARALTEASVDDATTGITLTSRPYVVHIRLTPHSDDWTEARMIGCE